jgi:hypothetical protein
MVYEAVQTGIHQCDTQATIITLEMILAEPETTGATLHHHVLISIVMASRRSTLGGDEEGCSVLHVGTPFHVGFISGHLILTTWRRFQAYITQELCRIVF